MGCLVSLFKGIGYLIKWACKGLFYFLRYTWPVLLCVATFFLGAISSDAAFGGKYREWEMAQRELHTHNVTIHWDEGSSITRLKIRDDLNWNICGYNSDQYSDFGLFYTDYLDPYTQASIPEIKMPQQANKVGYKFMGLYTSPLGGTQFVNAAGYSVRTVDMDIDLYAVWQEVN